MTHIDYNQLFIFEKLVENGSISNTANHIGVSVAKVSRDLKLLEKSLQTILFYRRKSGIDLTHAGEVLYNKTKELLKIDKDISNYFFDNTVLQKENININISSTKGFSGYCTTKWAAEFLGKNPEITLRFFTTDGDIKDSRFVGDVSISNQRIISSEFEEILIRQFQSKFVASKKYIEKQGTPKSFEDLKNHNLISYSFSDYGQKQKVDWFLKELQVKSKYKINSFFSMLSFIQKGLGIGFMQEEFIKESTSDIIIFDHLPSKTYSQYLTYRKDMIQKDQVKKFVEFIKKISESYQ